MNVRKPVDRAERRKLLRASKLALADTPAKVAAVEFDSVRAIIGDLPAREQQRAWNRVAADLLALGQKLTSDTEREIHNSNSRPGSGDRGEQPRAGAPARARLSRIFTTNSDSGK